MQPGPNKISPLLRYETLRTPLQAHKHVSVQNIAAHRSSADTFPGRGRKHRYAGPRKTLVIQCCSVVFHAGQNPWQDRYSNNLPGAGCTWQPSVQKLKNSLSLIDYPFYVILCLLHWSHCKSAQKSSRIQKKVLVLASLNSRTDHPLTPSKLREFSIGKVPQFFSRFVLTIYNIVVIIYTTSSSN
jgi:hypothetical protein